VVHPVTCFFKVMENIVHIVHISTLISLQNITIDIYNLLETCIKFTCTSWNSPFEASFAAVTTTVFCDQSTKHKQHKQIGNFILGYQQSADQNGCFQCWQHMLYKLFSQQRLTDLYSPIRLLSSGAHNSGYGEWHPRGTRATQCPGV
jgi:hypothetical protein